MTDRTAASLIAAMFLVAAPLALRVRNTPAVVRAESDGMYGHIESSVSTATARNEEAARLCEDEIAAILARVFEEIERCAMSAANRLSTYGSCSSIVYRLAREKLGLSSHTSDYIEGRIRGRLDPAVAACCRELEMALDRYERALQTSTITLATELAQENPTAADQPNHLRVEIRTAGGLDAAVTNLGSDARKLARYATAEVVAVVDTIVVRSVVGKASQLAASVFAAPAATAAGSATVAVADGPIPVGDAIAVMGGVWTGYKLYVAKRRFRRAIKAALRDALPEMKRDVHHQLVERIGALQKGYQRDQDQIRNRLAADLARRDHPQEPLLSAAGR